MKATRSIQSNVHLLTLRHRSLIAMIIAVLPLSLHAIQTSDGQSSPEQSNAMPGILQDYIYGYAPVALEATRAIQTAVPDATTTPGRAPINQFAYKHTLATPDEQLIVRPNADTLYTTAWLDLQEPLILHVPDTSGRYYLMPLYDAYSNELASVGSRTTGDGVGNFAIVGPSWQGTLPDGLSGVLHAPTNTVWVLGRTLVRGADDLSAAVAVTSQYKLVPLSAYSEFLATGQYTPPTGVPVVPPNPDFVGLPITSAPGFSMPEFFDVLAAVAARNPVPPDQQPQAASLVLDGFLNQNQLTSVTVKEANIAFIARLLRTARVQNNWSVNLNIGNYGTDYLTRAAIAQYGLGANIPDDAVYPNTSKDSANNSLDGGNSYVIHFAPGQTPPVHGFWSVTVYDQSGFLVPNPINRYTVGSETGLVPNADGSIDILLQSTPPSSLQNSLQNNWLPTPTGPFNLTLRLYWPDPSALNGSWIIPPVEPVNASLP
jgi:hypothetical protein